MDRRGDDDPAPPTHATGLGECLQPLGALWQVVEGSEKEHGVGARIRQSERTRVAHLGTGERHATPTVGRGARLLHVQRHGIHQVDAVPAFRQPDGVSPGAAADIHDHGGRRRQISLEQRLGACVLERASPAGESVAFESAGVVCRDLLGIARRVVRSRHRDPRRCATRARDSA